MTLPNSDSTRGQSGRWVERIAVLVAVLALGGGVAVAFRSSAQPSGARASSIDSRAEPEPPVLTTRTIVEPSDGERAQPTRLAVAGDVGMGNSAEYATAESMDRFEQAGEYDALLLLGDNVYPGGNPDELDKRVFTPFSGVLDGSTQLLPVLGNHDDNDGHGDAQVAALGMPGRWYSTVIGNTLIVSLDSNRPEDADQLAWLDETLAGSREPWKIVEMHHPPYSGGEHGSDEKVRDAFGPLFERYGVQLVLTGHEHDYQRTEPINGVTYVISGAASLLRDTGRADFTEVALSVYQFTDIVVTGDRLDLRAIGHDDNVIDQVTLTLAT